jgi:hypothetical protein
LTLSKKRTKFKLILKKEADNMCDCCCEKPENPKKKPENCSTEQKKEHHGSAENHPCEDDEKK